MFYFSLKIISNTTVQRPDSVRNNPDAEETGGLSGKPLFNLSTNILKDMFILTKVIISFKNAFLEAIQLIALWKYLSFASHYRERFLLLAVEVSAGTLILNFVTIFCIIVCLQLTSMNCLAERMHTRKYELAQYLSSSIHLLHTVGPPSYLR